MKITLITLICSLVFNVSFSKAQNNDPISGRITDSVTGEPLSDVTVSVIGTQISTSSNPDGYFLISELTPDSSTLRFSCIGYRYLKMKHWKKSW